MACFIEMDKPSVNIFWFRRDLRLEDNHALFLALTSGIPVLPIFIFDTQILDKLEKPFDLRVQFIHEVLSHMHNKLVNAGAGIRFFYTDPKTAFTQLMNEFSVDTVYVNHDYEPYARERDATVEGLLQASGAKMVSVKDQVIFEKSEVVKDDGSPYTVFTPYSRKWKTVMTQNPWKTFASDQNLNYLFKWDAVQAPALESMGFKPQSWVFPSATFPEDTIRSYSANRNFPALPGTSKLGIHLRFGTISIRALASNAFKLDETFLNELIWRDFYHMILYHFPHVGKGEAFKRDYDRMQWRHDEEAFSKWCKGETGYPIVDAGMRELLQTGFMHNRVRMITASFLTKHLLIDWRWGEAWFASKLLDFDLAANNGGWQWAAGSGCDAAPYFRVFNPTLQAQKFDAKGLYIRHWVPELDTFNYPQPMVNHEFARKRCLEAYSLCLKRD